jgi:hydrogenase nickel incorporation protein HypA/HybF
VHELSLCGAIADVASRRAGSRKVAAVHVRIGQLRQVVPDTLTYCWTLVVADTELDGALLEVEAVPALLRCRGCAAEFGLVPMTALTCAACGALDAEVVTGEEFDVTALDLVGA